MSSDQSFLSANPKINLALSISLLALALFFAGSVLLPFRQRVLSTLNPKSASFASTGPFVCDPCSADIDHNKVVGPGDVTTYSMCQNKKASQTDDLGNSCSASDVNQDGLVNKHDLDCILSQFRQICQ